MALADELAYMTATEMAGRIRRRQLSPVEIVDAVIERIEERNPSLNAFIFKGYDDARERRQRGRARGHVGRRARPAARRADGDQGPVRLQARLAGDLRRRARAQGLVIDAYCVFAERIEQRRRDPRRQDQQPGDGLPRRDRQLPLRADRQPVRHRRTTRAAPRAAARRRGRRALSPSPRAPTAAARSASRPPGAASTATRPSFGRVPMVIRPNAFARHQPVHLRGAAHAHASRTRRWSLNALSGYDPRDPFSLDEKIDFVPARRAARSRACRSPTARLRRLPGRSAHRERGRRGGRRLRGGRRHCRGGQARHQARPARAQRPLVPADHAAQHRAFERMRKSGLDLLGEHRDDFPPEFLHWIDATAA